VCDRMEVRLIASRTWSVSDRHCDRQIAQNLIVGCGLPCDINDVLDVVRRNSMVLLASLSLVPLVLFTTLAMRADEAVFFATISVRSFEITRVAPDGQKPALVSCQTYWFAAATVPRREIRPTDQCARTALRSSMVHGAQAGVVA